jgi:hypothetical protein
VTAGSCGHPPTLRPLVATAGPCGSCGRSLDPATKRRNCWPRGSQDLLPDPNTVRQGCRPYDSNSCSPNPAVCIVTAGSRGCPPTLRPFVATAGPRDSCGCSLDPTAKRHNRWSRSSRSLLPTPDTVRQDSRPHDSDGRSPNPVVCAVTVGSRGRPLIPQPLVATAGPHGSCNRSLDPATKHRNC